MEEVNIKTKLIGYSIVALFILVLFLPSGSACIFKLTPNLVISYDTTQSNEVITLLETTAKIDIYVDYQVTGSLVRLRSIPEYMDRTTDVYIDLEVDTASLPGYVSASITPNQVSVDISQELTRVKQQVLLFVRVDETAPAFLDFYVKIKATAHKTTSPSGLIDIKGATTITEISLKPDFAGFIEYSEPKGNYMEIGPEDTAEFPIKITNLGNAPTIVKFKILDFPDKWIVNIQESLILPSSLEGQDSSRTVVLRAKPPPDSGYHNERQTVQVRLTSSYYRDPNLKGQDYTLSFTIDNRGFSNPPSETSVTNIIITLIIIVLVIMSIILILIYKSYKSKLKEG